MKKKFNKYSESYDMHAIVQNHMATELSKLIKMQTLYNDHPLNDVLEAGCGTGNYSQLIHDIIKPNHFTLNDICRNMLSVTKQKLSETTVSTLDFIEADFETLTIPRQYNLITANAVFQWFTKLEEVFANIYHGLSEKGILAFSIFIDGTFHEMDNALKRTYDHLGLPFKSHILNFYTKDDIEKKLTQTNFKKVTLIQKDYTLFYDNALAFLKSLQQIGASSFQENAVKYSIVKKMLTYYDHLYLNIDNKIPATYKVLFCLAVK